MIHLANSQLPHYETTQDGCYNLTKSLNIDSTTGFNHCMLGGAIDVSHDDPSQLNVVKILAKLWTLCADTCTKLYSKPVQDIMELHI